MATITGKDTPNRTAIGKSASEAMAYRTTV
jgi:hypothetical protein